MQTIDKLREVWPRLSSDEKKLFDVQSSARSEAFTAEATSPAKKCACNLRVQ
jgi:hypothetical protein